MAELDKILQKYVHEDANTLGVVQGVTFIVKDKHGKAVGSARLKQLRSVSRQLPS